MELRDSRSRGRTGLEASPDRSQRRHLTSPRSIPAQVSLIHAQVSLLTSLPTALAAGLLALTVAIASTDALLAQQPDETRGEQPDNGEKTGDRTEPSAEQPDGNTDAGDAGTGSKSGEPVRIETLDRKFDGLLLSLSVAPDGPTLETNTGQLPLRDVLRLEFLNNELKRRDLAITLADGSRLYGGLGPESNDTALAFNGPLLPNGVRIPLEWVRRIDYSGTPNSGASPTSEGVATNPVTNIPDDADAVITQDGGVLTGLIESINGRGVIIEDPSLGTVDRRWRQIVSVHLAALDDPPSYAADAILVTLEGTDGSFLQGRLLEYKDAEFRLESLLVGTVTVPAQYLSALTFNLGRVAHLSDREPVRVQEGNPYTSAKTFERFFRWQRDRNVNGGPLRIGDYSFRKGIGVHSESRLTFAIEEGDRVFQSQVGIDTSARPRSDDPELASVIFKVLVDGQVRYVARDVNWESTPIGIEVKLEGGKELELVVEMGKSYHILDRANWGDARILRE